MPYMLDYEVERGLSSRKDDSASPLFSIQKETLWNRKLSHPLQSLHISLSKRTVLLHLYVLLDRI